MDGDRSMPGLHARRDRAHRPTTATRRGRRPGCRSTARRHDLSPARLGFVDMPAPRALTASTVPTAGPPRRPAASACRRRRYNRAHGPPSHPDPRRRHRSGAGGGDDPRPRRHRHRVRMGVGRGRRGGHRRARHAAPRERPRLGPAHQGRAQGPDHDARSAAASGASTSGCARRSACTPTSARRARCRASRSRYEDVDLVIVRENTEDLYAGIEHMVGRDAAESIKIITREASERIARLRLRVRGRQRPAQGHGRPQGEHHEAVGRAVPRELPDRRRRVRRPDRVRGPHRRQHVHAARPEARAVRRPRPAQPVRRHRQRPRGRAGRRPGRGARRQHRDRGRGLRAGPRLGAEVRRARPGEPDGDDPVGRPDAPPHGLPGRGDAGRGRGPRGHRRGPGHDRRPRRHGRHERLRRRGDRPARRDPRRLDDRAARQPPHRPSAAETRRHRAARASGSRGGCDAWWVAPVVQGTLFTILAGVPVLLRDPVDADVRHGVRGGRLPVAAVLAADRARLAAVVHQSRAPDPVDPARASGRPATTTGRPTTASTSRIRRVARSASRRSTAGTRWRRSCPFILQNFHRLLPVPGHRSRCSSCGSTPCSSLFPEGNPRLGLGSVIFFVNVALLSAFSLSCNSLRHLVGGRLDCFSCTRQTSASSTRCGSGSPVSTSITWRGHGSASSRSSCADLYVRMLALGVITDPAIHF